MRSTVRGRADFFRLGDWNAQCSICGGKFKASEMVQNWQGMWRCRADNESRQPQDFVRAVPDNALPAFIQPHTEVFVGVCDPNAISAWIDYATVDCVIVDYISPAFNPDIPPGE